MSQELRQMIAVEAKNILMLYAAFFSAPFFITKAFVMRPSGEPFRWPPREWVRPTSNDVENPAERAS